MIQNENLMKALKSMLHLKKSKAFYAQKLNVTPAKIDELFIKMKRESLKEKKVEKIEEQLFKIDSKTGEKTIESKKTIDFEPKSFKELAEIHKIDLDKFFISTYWSKLLPSGKVVSSVLARAISQEQEFLNHFKSFLTTYSPSLQKIETISPEGDKFVDVEISIYDFHLAKKYVEQNENCPIKRKELFLNICKSLAGKLSCLYNIDTLVFPISNDFFHTDNYQNQTTNGTPQDTILSYSEEYELGFEVLVEAIMVFKQIATNVKVVLVQGNHDKTKSFYLSHALEVFFKNDSSILFDRVADTLKGVVLGNTFIGYHHGNCKLEDLPLLFATHKDFSTKFGNAMYREVHTGDKHHYMAKEVKGVKIQQMPSLSGTDRWHRDNNFVHSVRAALALVYDKNTGKCMEIEERI